MLTQDETRYEETTVAGVVDGNEYTMAEFRKVFDSVCDKANWKNPFAAFVPHQIVNVVIAAAEFYHGSRPRVVGFRPVDGFVLIESQGYIC